MQGSACEPERLEPLRHELLDLGEEDELTQPVDEQKWTVVSRERDLVGRSLPLLAGRHELGESPERSLEDALLRGRHELDLDLATMLDEPVRRHRTSIAPRALPVIGGLPQRCRDSRRPLGCAAVHASAFGVRDVRIRGFRSARSVGFAPGPVCALVGGPSVGKSNVLAAISMLLEQSAPALSDISRHGAAAIHLSATLASGDEITLETSPPGRVTRSGPPVPVLFLPASERSGRLVAETTDTTRAGRIVREYFADGAGESSASPAAALVEALERLCAGGESGLVLLIEEPELFLRPQRQRYLYRLLRAFAAAGNQVLYSTHAPAFLNVGRLDELALVDYGPEAGTTIVQPDPLPPDESFRAVSEIDAERSELFLARAVLIVEGRTEKLAFPFVFRALGYDPDREAISIIECGGKPNVLLFVGICQAVRVPFLVVHDRDAAPGKKPIQSERVLNAQIAELAGAERTVVLARDFEAVMGLRGRGHKPARASELFSTIEPDEVPAQLRRAVEQIVALARG